MAAVMASLTYDSQYWCYQCREFVAPGFVTEDQITCSRCDDGFVEQIGAMGALSIQRSSGAHDRALTRREAEPDQGERSTVIWVRSSPVFGLIVTANSLSSPYIVRGRGATGGHFMEPGLDLDIQRLFAQDRRSEYGTAPASRTAVEAMPAVTVSGDHVPSECAVCKEDFQLDEVARQMPCQHMYHSHCILPWLELHNSCPLCRFQMPAVGDVDDQSRQREQSRLAGRNRNRRFSVRVTQSLRRLFRFLPCFTGTRGQSSSSG